jgi:hypothetical protein
MNKRINQRSETKLYESETGRTTITIRVVGDLVEIKAEGDRVPIPATAIGATLKTETNIFLSPEEAEGVIASLQNCIAFIRSQQGAE